MATIAQFQKRLSRIASREALHLILFVEIKTAEKYFIEAQKEQLNKGEDNEGGIFGTYSAFTEDKAKLDNTRQPKIEGQPYNFEYYGDFFDDMVLDVFEDKASFFSEDPKTTELIKKYKGLFGLQPETLNGIIKTYILPSFLKQIRNELLLS